MKPLFEKHIKTRTLMGFIILLMVALHLDGCQKMPINGDLDGQWQVMEVTTDGQTVTPPQGSRFYYNFYLHVCQLSVEYGRPPMLAANMDYEGSTIYLDFPFIKEDKVDQEWIGKLKYWGLPEYGEVTFEIQKLTDKLLILKSGTSTVSCRRF